MPGTRAFLWIQQEKSSQRESRKKRAADVQKLPRNSGTTHLSKRHLKQHATIADQYGVTAMDSELRVLQHS
jgi:hypothetical protein